jgi:hypothetical protein
VEKNVLPLLEIEPNFLGFPAPSGVIVQILLSQISPYAISCKISSFEMMQIEFHEVRMCLTIVYCSELFIVVNCLLW